MFYYAVRRVLKYPRRVAPLPSQGIRSGFALKPPVCANLSYCAPGSFEFLSRKIEFGNTIDWDYPEAPALWRYNMHYFDYLRQEDMRVEHGLALMQDWILKHTNMEGVGWHPYPTSLRLVNWIYFISLHFDATTVPQSLIDSIALQAAWLGQNVEHHILANHLFVNAKAILFAGTFLGGSFGDRCLALALEILRTELDEQFLDDGGHYERTPMYHRIMTHDLIDLSNLIQSNQRIFSLTDCDVVTSRAKAALTFINQTEPPDHSVPFFNDSTNGIAAQRTALVEFSERIFGSGFEIQTDDMNITQLKSSGYYIVRESENFLMIDCGEIGPDYQPGHAHCDTLSYEYFQAGRKTITNCGNFDYELSAERQFARSTAAHNTLVVDGKEQSEIWGAFRVGRRARPIHAALTLVGPGHARFCGAHDGYEHLSPGVVHERTVDYYCGGTFRVADTVAGAGKHSVDSYVHFVAGLSVKPIEGGFSVVDEHSNVVLHLIPFAADGVEVVATERFPEFGVRKHAVSLRIYKSGVAPFSFGYEVTP